MRLTCCNDEWVLCSAVDALAEDGCWWRGERLLPPAKMMWQWATWHGEDSHCPSVVLITGHWESRVEVEGRVGELMDGRWSREGSVDAHCEGIGVNWRRWKTEIKSEIWMDTSGDYFHRLLPCQLFFRWVWFMKCQKILKNINRCFLKTRLRPKLSCFDHNPMTFNLLPWWRRET